MQPRSPSPGLAHSIRPRSRELDGQQIGPGNYLARASCSCGVDHMQILIDEFVKYGLTTDQAIAVQQQIKALQFLLWLDRRGKQIRQRKERVRMKRQRAKEDRAKHKHTAQETTTEAMSPVGDAPQPTRPRWSDWDRITMPNIEADSKQENVHEVPHKKKKRRQENFNFICRKCGTGRIFKILPERCLFCGSTDIWQGKPERDDREEGKKHGEKESHQERNGRD